jgi:hypothetical protein
VRGLCEVVERYSLITDTVFAVSRGKIIPASIQRYLPVSDLKYRSSRRKILIDRTNPHGSVIRVDFIRNCEECHWIITKGFENEMLTLRLCDFSREACRILTIDLRGNLPADACRFFDYCAYRPERAGRSIANLQGVQTG